MGLLGEILGPIASIGGSLLGGIFGNERQAQSQDFSAQQYATRYQTTVKDMQAAGLNPMLAYQQGVGNSPTSTPMGVPDWGASWGSAINSANQIANQSELVESQKDLNVASAEQARAYAAQATENAEKIKEEVRNIPIEGERLWRTVELLKEQADNARKEGLNITAQNAVIRATASKVVKEGDLLGFDIDAAQKLDNLGRTTKELKPIVDILIPLLRSNSRK